MRLHKGEYHAYLDCVYMGEAKNGEYVTYEDHCEVLARLMEKSMDGEVHDHLVDLKALAARLAEDDDADRMHYANRFFEIIDKALVLLNPRT